MSVEAPVKPLLRGHFHQAAFFISIGACLMLVFKSSDRLSLISSITYSLGIILLFGISALYHRPTWNPEYRRILKKLDHSAIFVMIAGTFTPICLLGLPPEEGNTLLLLIWSAATLGLVQSTFWVNTPKWVSALLYLIMGYLIVPFFPSVKENLGNRNMLLIIIGGLIYTIGAVTYALKKPNFAPAIFGYHELFHVLVVIAAIFHFIVIYSLIK